ncbi:uncharacterized protein BT62DRAFT_926167 [Guyanagaster necrorhizus]|uniref:F-box domain-containing protein n=1 Tax=Guyanagaster necrorhizus TaxID=856835 RepID=A0A9P8AY09_9AGAR|nr:uncharacterized protein BT62DRAFT_926167 [Guyanagaster necrorhizus MCA 3950]KAG7451970.1 hypothetical protein BT62DRAFT_926167 [Guyanagaster necrorhizus MCA 3950]
MISPRHSRRVRKTIAADNDSPEPVPAPVKHRTKKQRTEKPKSELRADSDSGNHKSSKPPTRRRKGVLTKVAETPLDVLFEIFQHLEPLDLLRLSRTTKDLRTLLLQRQSSFIWKSARENVKDLPPLPDDMIEPRYASLVFDNHCQNCFAPTKLVQWQFRLRYCRICLYNSPDVTKDPYELPDEMLQLVPRFILNTNIGRRKRCETFYHTPSINALEECLCHGCDLWFDEIETSYWRLVEHSDACEKWASDRAAEHADKLNSLRVARGDNVVERLAALGWGEEIKEMDNETVLRRHKLVWQVKPLTDRIWSAIEPAMIELMESLKAKRLDGCY